LEIGLKESGLGVLVVFWDRSSAWLLLWVSAGLRHFSAKATSQRQAPQSGRIAVANRYGACHGANRGAKHWHAMPDEPTDRVLSVSALGIALVSAGLSFLSYRATDRQASAAEGQTKLAASALDAARNASKEQAADLERTRKAAEKSADASDGSRYAAAKSVVHCLVVLSKLATR
jgi:hypothetical protein